MIPATAKYWTCEVKLTQDELLDAGAQLSKALGKIGDLRTQLAMSTSVIKGEVQKQESEVHRLSKLIREGKTEREVEVDEQVDRANQMILTIRRDTFDVVHSRPMNEEEIGRFIQPSLFSTEVVNEDEQPTPSEIEQPTPSEIYQEAKDAGCTCSWSEDFVLTERNADCQFHDFVTSEEQPEVVQGASA